MDVKLLTIDVWDTILRRKCHPDAVKVHVSSHLLNNYFAIIRPEYRDSMKLFQERQAAERKIAANLLSSGMDDEYRQLEVYREWLQIVLSNKDSIDAITITLESVEIEQEKHVIYADPGIETFLTSYPCRDRVFVSDFYMSAQIIADFVKHAGLGHLVDRGYSSCDHYLNKRSGRFFRLVLEKENVDKNMSDSQVGARPKKSIRDHLFVLNSIINSVKQKEGPPVDIQIYNVRTCFDSLWLQQCCNYIYEAGLHLADCPKMG